MQTTHIALGKSNIRIPCVYLSKSVPVSGDLLLVMVQRGAVTVYDLINSVIGSHYALYLIGAFDRLHSCDRLEFGENICELLFPVP